MISKQFVAYLIMIMVGLYIILPHQTHQLVHYVITTKHGEVSLWLEEASNDLKRIRGLMWRKQLPRNHGMIFIYDQEEKVDFWMKDTFIPLDMIFLNKKGEIIGIKENTVPKDLNTINFNRPCKYVIEVNAGEVKKHDITVGDRLKLENNLSNK